MVAAGTPEWMAPEVLGRAMMQSAAEAAPSAADVVAITAPVYMTEQARKEAKAIEVLQRRLASRRGKTAEKGDGLANLVKGLMDQGRPASKPSSRAPSGRAGSDSDKGTKVRKKAKASKKLPSVYTAGVVTRRGERPPREGVASIMNLRSLEGHNER